jgi:multidrug efflux pump subunit AcrA (membrane-fusion protein)
MASGLDALRPLLKRRRTVAIGAAALLVLAAATMVAHRRGDAAASNGVVGEQSAVIQTRPFVSTIGVSGMIAAGPGGEVTAPFDGVVRTVSFLYGEPVEQGQVLAVFDVSDVASRRNEAEAATLKADQTAADYANWSSGPDVSRARRAVAMANSDLQDVQRRIDETKTLLDRGLVPRGEYDDLVRQRQAREVAVAAAQQDLTVVMRRGEGPNRRVAALELQNARIQLTALNGQVARAVVRAPVRGVMVRPLADKPDAVTAIHPGLQMTKGQLIGAVAAPDALVVTFKLGEIDANRVRPGQTVTVTGPGFSGLALTGRVTSVAGEATPPSAGNPTATVAAMARLEGLTPEQAAVVRIGMSANIVIDVYRNPSAIVAPPAALQGAAPAATVTVKDRRTGQARSTPVRLGQVTPDGVEVLSGLKPGDVVVWTPPSPVPTAAS